MTTLMYAFNILFAVTRETRVKMSLGFNYFWPNI